MAGQFVHEPLDVGFPNAAIVAGGLTTRYRVLTPINVTRGVISLVRMRGRMNTQINTTNVSGAGGQTRDVVPFNIQLCPARNGSIVNDAVLDPRNAADLESNRILWRYTMYIDAGSDQNGLLINASRFFTESKEIDIKVKRRYDVSEWALLMVVAYDTVDEIRVNTSVDMRGLFLATDGL